MQSLTVSKDSYEEFIKQAAEKISVIRRLASISEEFKRRIHEINSISSTTQEMESDWRNACSFINSKILYEEGKKFMDLDPACYPQLEKAWLQEMKKVRAYFIWEQENQSNATLNYLRVCDSLNAALLERTTLSESLFINVRDYIEKKYLTGNGTLDETRKEVTVEIDARAHRAWEFNPKTSEIEYRPIVKKYLEGFYENIIPAVVKKSTVHVEKIFQSFRNETGPDPYGIVSCFEVVLALVFLDKSNIKAALQNMNIKSPL